MCPQHRKLLRVAAQRLVDGAAFSAAPCQKWTHSRAHLLYSTPGEAHRGRQTRRALAVLTEASCVRGISLDRLPLPLFMARGGPRLMRGEAFASTWRWFTRTAKCIADLPACWMDGWIEWTGIMRRVKGNLISPMGCNPLFIKGPVCHFQWPLVVGKNIAGKWTPVSFSCAMFTLEL